ARPRSRALTARLAPRPPAPIMHTSGLRISGIAASQDNRTGLDLCGETSGKTTVIDSKGSRCGCVDLLPGFPYRRHQHAPWAPGAPCVPRILAISNQTRGTVPGAV